METDLTAREPIPWIEFVEKYTYPEEYDFNSARQNMIKSQLMANNITQENTIGKAPNSMPAIASTSSLILNIT